MHSDFSNLEKKYSAMVMTALENVKAKNTLVLVNLIFMMTPIGGAETVGSCKAECWPVGEDTQRTKHVNSWRMLCSIHTHAKGFSFNYFLKSSFRSRLLQGHLSSGGLNLFLSPTCHSLTVITIWVSFTFLKITSTLW